MPVDIILYALVALGLVLWLRSLLGIRPDDDTSRPSPFLESDRTARTQQKNANAGPGIQGQTPASRPADGLNPDGSVNIKAGLGPTMGIDDRAESGLLAIMRADRAFDAGHFLTGAQDAFVMIVEAFANGDKEALRHLLDQALFTTFAAAIDARVKNGERASVEIQAVRRSEIIEARLDGRMAVLTVRFVADETNLLYAADDTLKHGNPDRVSETVDIWTFTRDTQSRSPGWALSATRDDDGIDPDVPDGAKA